LIQVNGTGLPLLLDVRVRANLEKLRENPMESKNPFDAVRSMMEENLAKVGSATKNYLDLLQKSMLSVPNANEDQINAFRTYIDRQVAANQAFVTKLIGAKDIQEAMQIQVEYFQSQMKTSVSDAMQLTDKMAASSKRSA
jgi:hypothetical protein